MGKVIHLNKKQRGSLGLVLILVGLLVLIIGNAYALKKYKTPEYFHSCHICGGIHGIEEPHEHEHFGSVKTGDIVYIMGDNGFEESGLEYVVNGDRWFTVRRDK